MRWQVKLPPISGEKRETQHFCWLPRKVNDFVVWLEFYTTTEAYFQPANGSAGWWYKVKDHLNDYYC